MHSAREALKGTQRSWPGLGPSTCWTCPRGTMVRWIWCVWISRSCEWQATNEKRHIICDFINLRSIGLRLTILRFQPRRYFRIFVSKRLDGMTLVLFLINTEYDGQNGWASFLFWSDSRLADVTSHQSLEQWLPNRYISFSMQVLLDMALLFIYDCAMTETPPIVHSWWGRYVSLQSSL